MGKTIRKSVTCDAMLGKLARWLRLSGYQTYYNSREDDTALLDMCIRSKTILLTRDRELERKARKLSLDVILIKSNGIENQLLQLVRNGFEIKKEPSEALCPMCGSEVRETEEKEISSLPQKIRLVDKKIYICSKCGKIYWEGSHWKKIRERVEKIEYKLQNSRGKRSS